MPDIFDIIKLMVDQVPAGSAGSSHAELRDWGREFGEELVRQGDTDQMEPGKY